jgi:hypothetical protein
MQGGRAGDRHFAVRIFAYDERESVHPINARTANPIANLRPVIQGFTSCKGRCLSPRWRCAQRRSPAACR